MGLDIYIYERAHHDQNERHEREWSALYERKDAGEITEAEYDELRKQITQYASHADAPSERYPDHLFNRRYLRSSYNGGGFNHAVPDFLATSTDTEYPNARGSLYWIFEPMGREWDGDEGILTAADIDNLRASKARALEVADELRKCDPLRVMSEGIMIGPAEHMWHKPPTEAEVLAWYRAEKANLDRPRDGGYSNAKGTVFGFEKGLEVLAVAVGSRSILGPAAILVYRQDVSSYVESAEITAEFCDEAIALIERDGSCYLSWSG